MPFVVGLTGGAASGKSTAGALFQALGAALIDADAVSHALTGRDGKALGAIEKAFGQDFISDGALNRPRMRELVFHLPRLADAICKLHEIPPYVRLPTSSL